MKKQPKYHWIKSIKFKLFLMMLVVFITPLFAFSLYNIYIVKPSVTNSIHNEHVLSVTKISQSINKLVDTIETSLRTIVTTNYQIFDEDNQIERENIMYGTLKSIPYIEEVGLISEDGEILSKVSRRYSLSEEDEGVLSADLNLEDLRNNKISMGSPKLDRDHQIIFELTVPAVDYKGEFQGAITGVVNLRQIMKEITATDLLKGSYVMVLDENGNLIGHTDYSQVLRHENVRGSLGVRKLLESNKDRIILNPKSNDYQTLVYVSYMGEEVLGVYGNVPEINWGIVVEQPIENAYEELNKMSRNFNLYLAIILFIAMLTLIVYGIQIIKPIEELSKGVENIRVGNLDYTIPKYSDDEIGLLIDGFNSMTQDIKSSKEKEKLIMMTEKRAAIGTLAAGVAHEINNPMNNLIFYSTDLLDRIEVEDINQLYEDGTLKNYLEIIKEQIERSSDITQNLLKFSRDSKVLIEPIDLTKMVREVLKLMDHKLKKQNISVEFEDEKIGPLALGDDSQMRQVILNIISNSVDAIDKDGTIRIRIFEKLDGVFIEIEDNGEGIDVDNIKYIMDPFFTTKPLGKGTGLGLSISQAIMEKMGGNIYIESEKNIGTRVIVSVSKLGGGVDGTI